MEGLTSNNIVFRKEDINQMSFKGVNKKFGHNQQNYSLLKYKGGKNCHHFWELRVYKKIGSGEVDIDQAVKDGLILPQNPAEMGVRPTDMPNGGAFLKRMFNKIVGK